MPKAGAGESCCPSREGDPETIVDTLENHVLLAIAGQVGILGLAGQVGPALVAQS